MDYITDDMGPVVELPDPYAPWQTCAYVNPMVIEAVEIGSFEAYCRGHFGWGWIDALRERLEDGNVPVGKSSVKITQPETVTMVDASIVRIEFSRLDRIHFYADAVITAEIELAQVRNGRRESEKVSQWYRDRFIFRIFAGGYDLEEIGVTVYDKRDRCPGLSLSEYLIPVLSEENTEEEAEELLRQYYPEALAIPQPIDAMLLAGRMGLTVVDAPLYSEQLLMGQAVFYEGTVRIHNEQTGRIEELRVEPGMILVNSRCKMNEVQRNTTIIHECIHHYEHDLFIWAQTLYRNDICSIRCPVVENSFIVERQSPVHWAEMQARLITYRAKMNRLQTERKIQMLEMELSKAYPNAEPERQLVRMIQRLSVYFRTSKQCARKRMLELGHEQVRGVMNYVNGEYVPPYFFADDVLEKNETFVISLENAAAEYGRNEYFRTLVDSGHYVYVEGKFCQNKPEYVRRDRNGKLYLTSEARHHTEACCLRFEIAFGESELKYAAGVLNRNNTPGGNEPTIVCPQNAAEPGLCSPEDFLKEAGWITSVRKKIGGMDFSDALVYLMKERKCTIEKLEEKSLLSCRTISRLRNETEYDVTWAHVVALSVGLQLPPAISNDLLEKAGLKLRNNVAHNVYSIILSSCYTEDIMKVNSYLVKMGMEPLSEMAKAV